MNKRYSEEQIINTIKQHEAGPRLTILAGIWVTASGRPYSWRNIYADLEVNEGKRLKELESENSKLKKILAYKLLEVEAYRAIAARMTAHADLIFTSRCQLSKRAALKLRVCARVLHFKLC